MFKNPKEIACHSCRNGTQLRGRIPDALRFAGRDLDSPLPGGNLYVCPNCHLNFRYPRPSKRTLDRLYTDGSANAWENPADRRRDWAVARQILDDPTVARSVLDVGCFDGGFLDSLGSRWGLHGVEIHPTAAARAEERGVEIICRNYDDLGKLDRAFGVVTAFDVVEHVEDPLLFLRQLSRLVLPGGIVTLSTGNTETLSWMLLGSRYYYCVIPEHISFINPKWCAYAVRTLGLTLVHMAKFSREPHRTIPKRVRQTALNITYALMPRTAAAARSLGFGGLDVRRHRSLLSHPPYWGTARDHFLVCFKKK